VVKLFIKSDPWVRDITTIILSPNLASHAPMVSIIKARVEILIIPEKYRQDGSINTIHSIMPSKHRRVISKCVRWVINVIIVIKYAIRKYIDRCIDLMKNQSQVYKTSALI
jgi:hypothetical protein